MIVATAAKRWLAVALDRLGLRPIARRVMRAVRAPGVATIRPTVVRVLPHDPRAFTQGLAYADGWLYESTGLVGESTLRQIAVPSGEVRRTIAVPDVWAEGIAICNRALVQLTYTEGRAMIRRLPALEPDGTFHYDGEGWGLASTGAGYVMSDGSACLQFRDGRFAPVSRLEVRLAGRPLAGLNDLERVGERILACVLWHSDVYEIDARSGDVRRVIDCSEIVARSGRSGYRDVLNGIAFAADRGTFFVTGKHWPTLFEIGLPR